MRGELRTLTRLYRNSLRLRTSTALGDPVASVLDLPRGADGHPSYERIRARGDLVRGRSGLCMSASYSVCNEVLRDNRFRVAPTSAVRLRLRPLPDQRTDFLVHPLDDSLASANPPEHTRLRKLVAPLFGAAQMRARREFVEDLVERQLDRLAGGDPVDLIDGFALRIPSLVIADLLGLPAEHHDDFARWGIEFGATVDGARGLRERQRTRVLLAELTDYFADAVAARRGEPGPDMISALTGAIDTGDMTEAGVVSTCQALLIGGFVTTANIIGNAVVALSANPDQRAMFAADLDLAGRVVEETLRWEAPAQYSVRVAGESVELAGQQLSKGTPVVLLLAAANRDPDVFTEPGRFDITRANARDHLSFAAGVHYCLGAGLARMEGEIALRALYRRYPHVQAVGAPSYCPSRVIRGPQRLLVRTHAA
ncbi:cytochrome P450 [Nocardia cyriacigeorgica]|uniref:cytochrome P450 n=1 Tax=Nocardia cyriacigeorgica TaxID=135487 RepID=UPI0024579290|nr:cytochrome P450 [Nocardia cyriacigeorgica]